MTLNVKVFIMLIALSAAHLPLACENNNNLYLFAAVLRRINKTNLIVIKSVFTLGRSTAPSWIPCTPLEFICKWHRLGSMQFVFTFLQKATILTCFVHRAPRLGCRVPTLTERA